MTTSSFGELLNALSLIPLAFSRDNNLDELGLFLDLA